VHWLGEWLGQPGRQLECRHSSDVTSKELCGWLVRNTSQEFPDLLPRKILTCHGYRFPDLSTWDQWKSVINLSNGSANQISLTIDFTDRKIADRAIRLAVLADDSSAAVESLPPLFGSENR
jgi:hypothetical protein